MTTLRNKKFYIFISILLGAIALISCVAAFYKGELSIKEILVRAMFFYVFPLQWIMGYFFRWRIFDSPNYLEVDTPSFWRKWTFALGVILYMVGCYIFF